MSIDAPENIMQTLTVSAQLQQAIVARRKKLKLSQAKVASRLGISQNRYSELESAIEFITLDRLLVLMSVLELQLQFGLKGDAVAAPSRGTEPTSTPGAIW